MRASASPRERQSPPAAAEFISNRTAIPKSGTHEVDRPAFVESVYRETGAFGIGSGAHTLKRNALSKVAVEFETSGIQMTNGGKCLGSGS